MGGGGHHGNHPTNNIRQITSDGRPTSPVFFSERPETRATPEPSRASPPFSAGCPSPAPRPGDHSQGPTHEHDTTVAVSHEFATVEEEWRGLARLLLLVFTTFSQRFQ